MAPLDEITDDDDDAPMELPDELPPPDLQFLGSPRFGTQTLTPHPVLLPFFPCVQLFHHHPKSQLHIFILKCLSKTMSRK